MPRVLIAPATLAGFHAAFLDVLKDAGVDVVFPKNNTQLAEDELLAELKGVHASIAGSEPYTRRVIAANPQLRVIARAGVGYDAVDCEAATEHGVAVTITPGTNQDAVAEHAFMLILALAKDLIFQHHTTMAGKWVRKTTLPLRGRTLGLAGLGRIGKATAMRGVAFGMNVIAFDPIPDRQFADDHGIRLVSWEELLRTSDYLSLHMPGTRESRRIINKQTLAQMKRTAFLINTSRGSLVDEEDLAAALKAKTIAGAGLDVFETEPPGDHPWFKLDNVAITPHMAGVDLQSRDDMALSAAEAILSLMRGEWPAEKIVNQAVRAKFIWS